MKHHRNHSPSSLDAVRARRWRRTAIALAVVVGLQLLFITVAYFSLARLDLSDHRNLYYLLWKSGLRSYEQPVAFGGLLHDNDYRDSLVGISRAEFDLRFPNTFWEAKHLPPVAQAGETWLVNNYQAAESERLAGASWIAIFKKNRLVELSINK